MTIAFWYQSSQIARLLHRYTTKSGHELMRKQENAFHKLKEQLTQAPVLTSPDFKRPFILQTGASDDGLGAALTQNTEDGEHVIAYASRSLTLNKKAYSNTENECLAIVWAVKKMRPYLEGYCFTVIIDHQSLT